MNVFLSITKNVIKSNPILVRLREWARKIREGANRITTHPRYKTYQRIIWGLSAIWVASVVAQSLPYYTYMSQAKVSQSNGLYSEAEALYRFALEDVRNSVSYRLVGPRDSRFATALNNLAELHRLTGDYVAADREYQELLAVAEKHMGKNSEPYALTLNNLGALYRDQGRYDESEKYYSRSIDCWVNGMKRTGDTRYAASLNGLGRVYRDQGRYEEAATKYKQGLDIRRRALGPDHPDVAEIEGNLAGVYRDTKQYEGAHTLYEHALRCDIQAFGKVHPYVATDLNNLGGLLRDMGRYEEALEKSNMALELRLQVLPPEHPHIAKSMLGIVETSMLLPQKDLHHNWQLMSPYASQARRMFAQSLGEQHPDYATACDTAASLELHGIDCLKCRNQGSLKRARALNATATAIRRLRLPPTHPDLVEAEAKGLLLAKLSAPSSPSPDGQAAFTEKSRPQSSK